MDFFITDNQDGYELDIDVIIQDTNWNSKDLNALILRATKAVIAEAQLNKYAKKIEFAVILTDSDAILKLNNQYRDKNKPTNTLSFPAQEINLKKLAENSFHDGFVLLGDVIFSLEVIESEAQEQNKAFDDHFTHLLVHSLLHLLGLDHELENDAEAMEELEIKILASIGIKSPYNTN